MIRDLIIERLVSMAASRAIVLVAVDGFGGAGKTTVANDLAGRLRGRAIPAQVVHFDDFYLPSSERQSTVPWGFGTDYDWHRLEAQVLRPLRAVQPVIYHRYNWGTDRVEGTASLEARGVVFVEGVYSSRRELSSLYDLKIWVVCPRPIRLARGLARDGEHARWRWTNYWMPQESLYAKLQRPHTAADFVVGGADPPSAAPAGAKDELS